MAAPSAAPVAEVNCHKGISHYINKVLKPRDKTKEISGMKCLLLDRETKTVVSMVYSMNEILTKEVFLVETLDAKHDSNVSHLKAVCIVRPTTENVRLLVAHLKEPKFTEYHIFFTAIVPQDILRKLADADSDSVVKQIQEYYVDYYAVNSDLFSVNLPGSLSLSRPKAAYTPQEDGAFKRSTQALLALLLSFKVKPYVRYQAASDAARALASEVAGAMAGERELFTFNRAGPPPLLVIMDRREDPVTPLLTQWTYQAMVHDMITGGIKNNTVSLKEIKGINKDLEEVVLSPTQDPFYAKYMNSNYGDLGEAVKAQLDEYSAQHKIHENVASIADMQRFIERYPELRSKGLVVSKHVALVSEISRIVDAKRLMDISEIEQNVVCSDNPNDHFRDITTMIANWPQIDSLDALRLLMLYSLRYERSRPDKVAELRRFIVERVDVGDAIGLVDTYLQYGRASGRGGELFSSGGVLGKLSSTVRRGLVGVQNVFTQHQPLLTNALDQLARGSLSKTGYPYVGAEAPPGTFSTVIVFMVGGATFEEANKVASINNGTMRLGRTDKDAASAQQKTSKPAFRVILGGTTVHSSKTFLAELKHMQDGHVSIDVPA